MFLLDTNIVSLLDERKRRHAPELVVWLDKNLELLFLSVVTIAELRIGELALKRRGHAARQSEIHAFIGRIEQTFAERILPVDIDVAHTFAGLRDRIWPQTIEAYDLFIAATAAVHGLAVLTGNTRHFAPTGVPVLDPLAGLPPA